MSSVTSTATTGAESAPKPSEIIQNDRARRELVFHLRFGGVPVVARPSGENFPGPSNQFQSIGQKNLQIPIPDVTYLPHLSFRDEVVSFTPT